MKITTRCGQEAVAGLNEKLLAKAAEKDVIHLDKVRADTTVVEANVAYPTDSGLLAKGVARLVKLSLAIKAAGLATRTTTRDRTRSVRRRAHAIAAWLRRRNDDAKEEVKAITGEMATIAEAAIADARHLAVNARRGLRRAGQSATCKAAALVCELERTADLLERVAAQTRTRLSGAVPDGSTRVVSLHDPDARPIAKGRLGRPVEFGYKAQVVDNADGVVLDHHVVKGNPPDAPMLVPAIVRIAARFGRVPTSVTADRGYGEAAVDAGLAALGVKKVVIPRRGKPGVARQKVQRARSFQKLVKWRTGSEARISLPETRLRMAAHPHRRHGRGPDVVRVGRPRPQRHQDQRADQRRGRSPTAGTDEVCAAGSPGNRTTGATASHSRRLTRSSPCLSRHARTAESSAEREVGIGGRGDEIGSAGGSRINSRENWAPFARSSSGRSS